MTTKYSLHDISSIPDKKVFFDANVLIYVFWPSGSSDSIYWENKYSAIFGRLLRQGNQLLVDFIVISEFVNRAHRMEYIKFITTNGSTKYKKYRNSVDGQNALQDIYLLVETNILSKFTVIGKSFTKTDIQSFLQVEPLDFGDKGILMTCKENACILLTNDVDFKMEDIDLLSANPRVLSAT